MAKSGEILDGVHIGLPESAYHSLSAMSSHQLMDIVRYPPDHRWKQGDNPLYVPPTEKDGVRAGRTLGTALHAWVLEGEEHFWTMFREPEDAPEEALRTTAEIKDWLEESGVTFKKSAPKTELEPIARENGAILYSDWLARREEDPREDISRDWLSVIQLIDRQIKRMPSLAALFKQGLPEVSIVWTVNGQRRKARLDLLTPTCILDLKSIGHFRGGDVQWAMLQEVVNRNYHMQMAWYLHARHVMRRLVERGLIHTHGRRKTKKLTAAIKMMTQVANSAYIILFAKTLDAPSICPIIVTNQVEGGDEALKAGRRDCAAALRAYKAWKDYAGDDLWFASDIIVNPVWPDRINWARTPIMPPKGKSDGE